MHRNAVMVGRQTYVGTLKSGKNRALVLPGFVVDSVAETAEANPKVVQRMLGHASAAMTSTYTPMCSTPT